MDKLFLNKVLDRATYHDYDSLDHRSLVFEASCEIKDINDLPEESEIFTKDGMEELIYLMTQNCLYARKISCLYSIFNKDNEAFQELFIKYTKEALALC